MKYVYLYKNIALPSSLISLLGYYSIWAGPPSGSGVLFLFWIRFIVLALLLIYIHIFRAEIQYFYYNLGIGKVSFYRSLIIMDMLIFSAGLIITLLLHSTLS